MARYYFYGVYEDGSKELFESNDYEELKEWYAETITDLHLGCSQFASCSFMYDREA